MFLALLAGAVIAGGCSTVSDPAADRGAGVRFNYAVPFDQVWAALPDILKDIGMRITRQDKAAGYMLVEQGGAFGANSATVYVEPIGTHGNSRIEVVAKGTLGINLGASDAEKSIHDRLAQRFRRF